MMNKNILYGLGLGALFLSSCAPVYKCGEERPGNFSAGNRIMEVVEERDDLCKQVKVKDHENELLQKRNGALVNKNDSLVDINDKIADELVQVEKKFNKLSDEHATLQKTYSTLLNETFKTGHMYDERLKEAERRMAIEQEAAAKRIAEKEHELAARQKKIDELERVIAEQDSIANRLNNLLREALLGFKSDELTVEIKNGKVYVSMSDKLMFKSGSVKVEQKGKEALEVLARVLSANEDFEILVEGHTDNVPIRTAQYADNWDLSVARATSMVRILVDEHKLTPERLTASGKGEFSPRASNQTAEGRAQNRRTEIILSPKLDELINMLNE